MVIKLSNDEWGRKGLINGAAIDELQPTIVYNLYKVGISMKWLVSQVIRLGFLQRVSVCGYRVGVSNDLPTTSNVAPNTLSGNSDRAK